MHVKLDGKTLVFYEIPLLFSKHNITNIFARKTNKTLRETLLHHRYKKFSDQVEQSYQQYLDWPLGIFLLKLKSKNDIFYLKFLNNNGDGEYCRFKLSPSKYNNQKGLYVFIVGETIKYVGKTTNSFEKRINQGYGIITPKNCYLDGQRTNC